MKTITGQIQEQRTSQIVVKNKLKDTNTASAEIIQVKDYCPFSQALGSSLGNFKSQTQSIIYSYPNSFFLFADNEAPQSIIILVITKYHKKYSALYKSIYTQRHVQRKIVHEEKQKVNSNLPYATALLLINKNYIQKEKREKKVFKKTL